MVLPLLARRFILLMALPQQLSYLKHLYVALEHVRLLVNDYEPDEKNIVNLPEAEHLRDLLKVMYEVLRKLTAYEALIIEGYV